MSEPTVYFVNTWTQDINGDVVGDPDHSLRPELDDALKVASEQISDQIALISDGKIVKCVITIYEDEQTGPTLRRIARMSELLDETDD